MKDVLIAGMGPGGLSAVNMLLKLSSSSELSVTVIDNRDSFTRNQKVHVPRKDMESCFVLAKLDQYGMQFERYKDGNFKLKNVPKTIGALPAIAQTTIRFLEEMSQSSCIASICEIQKYQFAILNLLKDPRCTVLKNTGIDSFDVSGMKKIAHVKDVKSGEIRDIKFDDLIVADGANSKTLEKIQQYFTTKPQIVALPEPLNNVYGYLVLDAKDFDFVNKQAVYTIKDSVLAQALYEIRESEDWGTGHIPLIYIHLDHVKKQIYCTGEIPKGFMTLDSSEAKNHNASWFKDIITKTFGCQLSAESVLENGVFTQKPQSLVDPEKLLKA